MRLDSFAADAELFGNSANTLFRSNKSKYRQLAIAQASHALWESLAVSESLDGECSDRRTRINFSRSNRVHCPHQFFGR